MKLSGQVSREYKGKQYWRHWVVIPSSVVEELGWKTGEGLEGEIKNGKLVIQKENPKVADEFKTRLQSKEQK